jgi:hypothetical protein
MPRLSEVPCRALPSRPHRVRVGATAVLAALTSRRPRYWAGHWCSSVQCPGRGRVTHGLCQGPATRVSEHRPSPVVLTLVRPNEIVYQWLRNESHHQGGRTSDTRCATASTRSGQAEGEWPRSSEPLTRCVVRTPRCVRQLGRQEDCNGTQWILDRRR